MSGKLRVIQYGLGPIGSAVTLHILERPGLELVGAVDVAPGKVGRDVGQVIGVATLGVPVVARLSDVTAKADVVTHCTNSYLDLCKGQVLEILTRGHHIVSTAEELSFPWLAHASAAQEIDAAAKRAGKAVLATGINPGFLMDSLPLNLTAICQQVNHISVTRSQNASKRRGPFQAKIGSGMSVQAFEEKMAVGRMGHVGLLESLGMVFHTLGKPLVRCENSVEPIVADRTIQTEHFTVQPGQVRGLKQVARGFTHEGEFMRLTFIAALDEAEDEDTIEISGRPNLCVKLQGTHGDVATIAIVVNAIRRVVNATPGLAAMRDLPLVTYWQTGVEGRIGKLRRRPRPNWYLQVLTFV